MRAQAIQILHIIALAAIPLVSAQNEAADYGRGPEIPIHRHAWPKLWFYSDGECKGDWSEPEILIDQTDDKACHQLKDRRSLGIERDPAHDPAPWNQASCMFLYKGKKCGGKATIIDIPFNDSPTCVQYSQVPGEYKSYQVSAHINCASYEVRAKDGAYIKLEPTEVGFDDGHGAYRR